MFGDKSHKRKKYNTGDLEGKAEKNQNKTKRLCEVEEHFQYLLKSLEHSALTSSGSEKQRPLKVNKHAVILSLPNIASVGFFSF